MHIIAKDQCIIEAVSVFLISFIHTSICKPWRRDSVPCGYAATATVAAATTAAPSFTDPTAQFFSELHTYLSASSIHNSSITPASITPASITPASSMQDEVVEKMPR